MQWAEWGLETYQVLGKGRPSDGFSHVFSCFLFFLVCFGLVWGVFVCFCSFSHVDFLVV